MDTLSIVLVAVLALAGGGLWTAWWRIRKELKHRTEELAVAQFDLKTAHDELGTVRTEALRTGGETAALRGEAARLREECENLHKAQAETERQVRELIGERAALQAKLEGAETKLREQNAQRERERTERAEAEEAMKAQFRNLANDILGEQSQTFRRTNAEALETLLKPFRQNITDFRERVEKIYATEAEQHGALKNELKNLMELNRQITAETTNLTRALKGDSKVQGDFGEMILDTILSSSNLVKGVHYQTQDTMKNEEGANVRPDVVLNLPDKKQIVIDSKTSLTAFAAYTAAEQPAERDAHLKAHVDSVRKHVAELASKGYQALLNASPDFVIMFIPNESAFLAAMQADPQIWADAYRKKVVVSSPTNLFALLKLVDNLWQRSDLERNTHDIAECGSKLYDQLVAFTDSLQDVEKGLKLAQRSYDDAWKRFSSGNNNLIRLGERMVGLNVKIKKRMPQNVLDSAELDEPADHAIAAE